METNQREGVSRARSLRDMVFLYLLLFTSGSVVYMGASGKYLVSVFLLVLGSWLLFSDRRINSGFALYVIIFTSFLFVIHLYTDGSLPIGTVIGSTIELLLAYLVFRIVRRNIFEAFINTVTLLAAISLLGNAMDNFHLFSGLVHKLPSVGEDLYEGVLYVFRPQGSGRNSSIFYEPGAYQAFLNTALFMLFFVRTRLSPARKWVYVSILVVALLTTFSTTGALIFGALFGLVLFKSELVSANAKMATVGVLSIIIVVFAAQFRYVVFDKIEKFYSIQDITDSGDRRSFDLLVDLEIFKRNIFGVGHKRYYREFSAVGLIHEGSASSNGVSSTLAIYGLPFSLFLFGSYFAFFRIYFTGFLMTVIPFSMVLIFLFSEGYYTLTPFCLALIAAIFAYKKTGTDVENNFLPKS